MLSDSDFYSIPPSAYVFWVSSSHSQLWLLYIFLNPIFPHLSFSCSVFKLFLLKSQSHSWLLLPLIHSPFYHSPFSHPFTSLLGKTDFYTQLSVYYSLFEPILMRISFKYCLSSLNSSSNVKALSLAPFLQEIIFHIQPSTFSKWITFSLLNFIFQKSSHHSQLTLVPFVSLIMIKLLGIASNIFPYGTYIV